MLQVTAETETRIKFLGMHWKKYSKRHCLQSPVSKFTAIMIKRVCPSTGELVWQQTITTTLKLLVSYISAISGDLSHGKQHNRSLVSKCLLKIEMRIFSYFLWESIKLNNSRKGATCCEMFKCYKITQTFI